MTTVAAMIGSNRIVTGAGIVHPLGNPDLDPKAEKEFRRVIVERALAALRVEAKEQKIFTETSHLA
jgi:glycine reductase